MDMIAIVKEEILKMKESRCWTRGRREAGGSRQ